MSKVWYGNLTNRLEENKMFCDEIKVGTGMTEYHYSDRHPYEVVEVIDQKHVKVRMLDHKHVGDGCMDNNWELVSNEKNPIISMTKRGNYWYKTKVFTSDILETADAETKLHLAMNGIDIEKLKEKGKITKYKKINVSFGHADYYFDYEF